MFLQNLFWRGAVANIDQTLLCTARYYLQIIQGGGDMFWAGNVINHMSSLRAGCPTPFSSWTNIDKTLDVVRLPKTQITLLGQLGFVVTKLDKTLWLDGNLCSSFDLIIYSPFIRMYFLISFTLRIVSGFLDEQFQNLKKGTKLVGVLNLYWWVSGWGEGGRDDICHKHTSSACVKLLSLG